MDGPDEGFRAIDNWQCSIVDERVIVEVQTVGRIRPFDPWGEVCCIVVFSQIALTDGLVDWVTALTKAISFVGGH